MTVGRQIDHGFFVASCANQILIEGDY